MRYFTVQEAEALIPELEKIFEAIRDIQPKAEAKLETVRRLETEANPDPAALALEKAQLEFLAKGMNEWFQKILDLGAMPKGLEPALVDFPYRLAGKEVYLCWRLGDDKITHYHGIDEGFAGRKRLPKSESR